MHVARVDCGCSTATDRDQRDDAGSAAVDDASVAADNGAMDHLRSSASDCVECSQARRRTTSLDIV